NVIRRRRIGAEGEPDAAEVDDDDDEPNREHRRDGDGVGGEGAAGGVHARGSSVRSTGAQPRWLQRYSFLNASTSASTCPRSCAAEICTRSLACPSGTTGYPKPITNTPSSS